jgi:four helix bundle protein
MKTNNIIQEKSFDFAIKIIHLYNYLINDKKEFVMSKQLLRSGTSIGANVEEAIGAQSSKDFIHKISISYKEARETNYWIKLLIATNYLSEEQKVNFNNDIEEICKILSSIQISFKRNNTNNQEFQIKISLALV